MQLLLTYFYFICAFLLFMFMVTRAQNRSKTQSRCSKSPPGPWKLPLVGNLHQLRGLPHRSLRDLAKKYGPLFVLHLGEIKTVIVSSPRLAEEVLKTQDLAFCDRPHILAAGIITYNYVNASFSPYGDYYKQLRKICVMELLGAKKVQSLWSIREEEVSDLIRNISSMAMSGSTINFSESVSSLTNDIISRAAFGKKCKDKDAFVPLLKEASIIGGGFGFEEFFPSLKVFHWISGTQARLQKIHQEIDKILEEILNEHIEKRSRIPTNELEPDEEDIVDVFLRLREENNLAIPMGNDNIKSVFMDIFAAGTETSSTALVWAMSELMRNPKIMAKAQDEVRRVFNGRTKVCQSDIDKLDYMRAILKETLRLHLPSALLLPRESRKRCELEGYEIPKGTKVTVNAWALARDPDFWPNAERFEPERFLDLSINYNGTNFSYLPFGAGRRMCPGISLGVANMELILAQLLYNFDWKLCDGIKPDELDMSESFGLTVGKKFPLNLVPTVYRP
ncbi:hypothetical protein ACHQM5_026897 [Ranunculus cassubicifolius]